MKILVISYHNPRFINTTVYREEAIKALGHSLISFDDNDYFLPGRVRQRFPFLQAWDLKRLNENLFNVAFKNKPDICLVVGGYTIFPETIERLKNLGIKMILWTTDAPRDFSNIFRTAPFYDFIFCAGTEAMMLLKEHGVKNPHWLPFGCDSNYQKPVSLSKQEEIRYKKDIVFVGSYYPNRAHILESIADFEIGIWGPNWHLLNGNSPLQLKAIDQRVNYDQWVKIYNASKIVLAIHFQDPKIPCFQISPKLFEALACRSFCLVDQQKDALSIFEDQKHVVFFRNEGDLREKINYYLKHQEERERIADCGYRYVLERHTFKHRIEEMLNKVT